MIAYPEGRIDASNAADLQKELERRFRVVKVHSPDASRPTSSEVYVIAKGFLAETRVGLEIPDEKAEKKKQFTVKGSFS